MPVTSCRSGDRPGWKCGEQGRCYTYRPGDEAASRRARKRAIDQCIAMGEPPGAEQIKGVDALNRLLAKGERRAEEMEDDFTEVFLAVLDRAADYAAARFLELATVPSETLTAAAAWIPPDADDLVPTRCSVAAAPTLADLAAKEPDLTTERGTFQAVPLDVDRKRVTAVLGRSLSWRDRASGASANIDDLSLLPDDVLRALKAKGTRFYVADASAPGLDDLGHLSGVRPRGWPEGTTWDLAPGIYAPSTNIVALGTGGHGTVSLALHETGHAIQDRLLPMTAGAEQLEHWHHVFRLKKPAVLSPYESQYGAAGQEEFFAEAIGHRFKTGRAGLVSWLGGGEDGETFATWLDDILRASSSGRRGLRRAA